MRESRQGSQRSALSASPSSTDARRRLVRRHRGARLSLRVVGLFDDARGAVETVVAVRRSQVDRRFDDQRRVQVHDLVDAIGSDCVARLSIKTAGERALSRTVYLI